MLKKSFLIIVISVLSISSIFSQDANEMDKMKTLLMNAEADAINYPAPWEVMITESEKKLKKFSEVSVSTCIETLSRKDITELQKIILINIMNVNINIRDYSEFLLALSENYLKGIVDDELMDYAFFCPFSEKKEKKMYLKEKKVQVALDNCLKIISEKDRIKVYKQLKRGKI